MSHPFAHLFGNLVPPGTLKAHHPPEFKERTAAQQVVHETITAALGLYEDKQVMRAPRPLAVGESIEWDKLFEKEAPGKWVGQNSGSCVGANGFNDLMMQILIEAIVKNTGELPFFDYFWLLTYGWGRAFAGFQDEGDGSYLSVQFKAMLEKGIPKHSASPDFPVYENRDGARWVSGNIEKWWARQKNFGTKYDDAADDHLVLDGAMIPSGRKHWQDAMHQSLSALDGGPVHYAGMLGWKGLKVIDGWDVAEWDDEWPHKMGFCGKGIHPKLGLMLKVSNYSWTPSRFRTAWIREKTAIEVLKHDATEIGVVRDFNGMAGLDISWLIDLILTLTGTK